jgi:hypothetical protein
VARLLADLDLAQMTPGRDGIEQKAEERRRRHPVVTRAICLDPHGVVEIRACTREPSVGE